MRRPAASLAVLVILAAGLIVVLAAASPQSAPETEIRALLKAQQEAWNARDIRGFMAYYWKSEDLTFQSGANRLRGWQAMLDRYLKSYSGDQWGRLEFSDLEIHLLGPEAAYVLGRWKVDGTGKTGQGVFTILLRRLPEGWRIVHDHTS